MEIQDIPHSVAEELPKKMFCKNCGAEISCPKCGHDIFIDDSEKNEENS
jgi:ribosomal protein S27AE